VRVSKQPIGAEAAQQSHAALLV